MSIAERIKAFREREGLTQKALAARMGISQQAIHDIESGRRVASARMISRLAATCGWAEPRLALAAFRERHGSD